MNVYKGVLYLLKKFSMFLKVVLKVCCGVWFLKSRQGLFYKIIQVTKSCLPLNLLKGFYYVFKPFDNFVPPLHLVDNLVLGDERDKRGSLFRP